MLPQNFRVSRQILNNIAKTSFPAFRFDKKISKDNKIVNWPKSKIYLTSVEYQKKLKQCSKPSFAQLCCKKLFSKPTLKKCDSTSASDDYLKARRSLKIRIENLVKFVEHESQSIASDIESDLKSSNAACTIQMDKLFRATAGKLDELIRLNVSYGSWMRKETLMLNDEIRRSFKALERTIAANAKHIMYLLTSLRSDMSMCIECTQRNLVACRKHDVPSKLNECSKKQMEEATKMLDHTTQEVRHKLKEIVKFRKTAMKAHEMTRQEVIEVNHTKASEFAKYLERCIIHLKKSSK